MKTRRPSGPIALTIGILFALLLAACGSDATATTAPAGQATTAAAITAVVTSAPTETTTATTAPATTGAATTTAATTTSPAATTGQATTAGTTTAAGGTGAATGSPAAGAQKYAIVPDKSKATYRVRETFIGRGLNTAVGSTGDVKGDIHIDKQNPSASRIDTITVDISKLQSDEGRRDRAIQNDWLESKTHPTATFKAKRLEGLPATPYTEGQELTFTIVGDLTVRNVTKEVTFDAKGKIAGDTFTGAATANFTMTDFGFDPPDIAGVLKAENAVILEMTIEAKRAN